MSKTSVLIAAVILLLPTISFADYSFDLTIDASGELQASIIISEDGDVSILGGTNLGAGRISAAQQSTLQSIQASLQGISLYEDSISSARARIAATIARQIDVGTGQLQVQFNHLSNYNNAFVNEQQQKRLEFENRALNDIFNPTFIGEYINSPISFDISEKSDVEALRVYHEARFMKYEQLQRNQAYREAEFSSRLIEVRQENKGLLSPGMLQQLTSAARSMLENDAVNILAAFELLTASNEFQTGFALSLANNFNPVSFIYPIEANCSSSYCQVGQVVGDVVSAIAGAYELVQGLVLAVGSGGSGLVLTAATGGTAGPLILPASAAATVTGIAMAGHGLSTTSNSIKNIYSRLESDGNLERAKRSGALQKKLNKEEIEDLEKFSKETGLDLSRSTERYGEDAVAALAESGVREATRRWGILDKGKSQLIEHSLGRDLDRLYKLEVRGGLPQDDLARVLSGGRRDIAAGMKSMDQLAHNVIKSPNALTKTTGPGKQEFWLAGALQSKLGIRVILFEGKIQTIMPQARKSWERIK